MKSVRFTLIFTEHSYIALGENPYFNSENKTNLKARTTGLKLLKYSTNLIAIVNRSVGSSSSREIAHSTLHIAFFYLISIKAQIFALRYDLFNSFKFPLTQTLSHSIVRSIFMQTCMHFCEEEYCAPFAVYPPQHANLEVLKCVQTHGSFIKYSTCTCTIPCDNLHYM